MTNSRVVGTARNIVDQILDGAAEFGGYELVDMKKRQAYNDVADTFVVELLEELILQTLDAYLYEWAIQSRTFVDGPYDRIEPMSLNEALRRLEIQRINTERYGRPGDDRLACRIVSQWRPSK